MSDQEFAEAVDALLWIGPSGDMRDNGANLEAVRWSLDERRRAIDLLHELLDALLPMYLWRDHPQVAKPLLEAFLFVQEQSGGIEPGGPTERST
ncbi:MAG: hypothetical protein WD273_00965 [Trueperaceae bacterium]